MNPDNSLVAIVGRPNVGKSTLFNRLAGLRLSIVSDISGTTRDRINTQIELGNRSINLVDTGGLDDFPETELWVKTRNQIHIAIESADVIIMVVDITTGITPQDKDVAQELRMSGKSVILAVNKVDNNVRESEVAEFYTLGLGDPVSISAYHNRGLDELLATVFRFLPEKQDKSDVDADFRLAIVGRTNVGKSMLMNAMTGEERAIVSEVQGTTRDTLDSLVEIGSRKILVLDTAGIRRKGKIEKGIEHYSTLRSMRAIDSADIVLLVMDATEISTSQDTHIASYILDAHKGIVLAINKWDRASELELSEKEITDEVYRRFKFISHAPICLISALRQSGISNLIETSYQVFERWSQSLPRYDLRRTVLNAISEHPPSTGRKQLKIFGVTQDGVKPPSFTFYVNNSSMVHFSYKRYLENVIREEYGFGGAPLRMRFKSKVGK